MDNILLVVAGALIGMSITTIYFYFFIQEDNNPHEMVDSLQEEVNGYFELINKGVEKQIRNIREELRKLDLTLYSRKGIFKVRKKKKNNKK